MNLIFCLSCESAILPPNSVFLRRSNPERILLCFFRNLSYYFPYR
ncbi:hypothetical protein LEP1GSC058_3139 [Leptospira fainei serovar Hurstbridge str. BUT 6]|uniref:Uncharacterized protein n=1 Tax=Leptospira fainei serovar Hurstbridge str. BUT 6 TaxID=1193011 RepID=S3VYL9_9LEPT|nr:hypothetical protein LEP1GSC058_3139 [Leptospira fainei serovar Hurstbridge str. BUT 6]